MAGSANAAKYHFDASILCQRAGLIICHLTGDLADGPSEPVGPSFFIPLSDAIHSVEKGTFP